MKQNIFMKFSIVTEFLLNDFFWWWVGMGIFVLKEPEEMENGPRGRIKTPERAIKKKTSVYGRVSLP